jgi:hypothetical protein
MRTFKNFAAQGDVMLRRVLTLPGCVVAAGVVDGKYIVAHSETGHNHVINERPNVRMYDTTDPLLSYLEVVEATDAAEVLLEHLRSFDTHEAIAIPPGIYEIRRQREYVPEGWRRAAD